MWEAGTTDKFGKPKRFFEQIILTCPICSVSWTPFYPKITSPFVHIHIFSHEVFFVSSVS